MEHASNLNIHILLILMLVSTAVALVVKWVRLPYAIALVFVGLIIGIFHLLPPVTMTPELILVIFLPSMLFEASWNLDLRTLKKSFKPVATFATLGVIISTLIIGGILMNFGVSNLTIALMFGAIISATDPISVLALFRQMGVEKRLTTILEGESLLNDGTAVVLFKILLGAALAGGTLSWGHMGAEFLIVTLGGTIAGAAIGFAASRLVRHFDDHLLEITLTVLVAYGSYLLAEQIHVSSVIAVLTAGMVMGTYGSRTGMSPSTRLAVHSFWEYAAFLAESLVFLLIGMQIKVDLLEKYAPSIGIAIAAMLVARLVVIYGLAPFLTSRKSPIPLRWCHLLFWGGLRGSLCMAMALSLPETFPMREQLIVMTFGVALFTLFVQGLTMEPLVNWLHVKAEVSGLPKYRALVEEMRRHDAQLAKLKDNFQTKRLSKKEYMEQKKAVEQKKEETAALIDQLRQGDAEVAEIETTQAERALLEAQKDCLIRLERDGTVSGTVIESFRIKINEELEALPRAGGSAGERASQAGERASQAGERASQGSGEVGEKLNIKSTE